jgi:hypothetical protein
MPEMKRHPVIDGFLSEIDPRLRRLPEARRAAEREELAQHLDLLVTAYAARGLDENAAARAAIERFGRAERIGVDLAKAGGKTAEYALFFAWYSTFIVGAYLALFWSIGDPLPRHLPWVIVASAVLLPSAFICADVRKRRRATAK